MDVMDIGAVLVVFLIKELGGVQLMFLYCEFVQNNKNTNLYNIQYNKEQLYDYHFHHKLCATIKYANLMNLHIIKIIFSILLVLLFPLLQHLDMSEYSFLLCQFFVNVLATLIMQNFFLNPKLLKFLQVLFVGQRDTEQMHIVDTNVINKNDKWYVHNIINVELYLPEE